MDACENHGTDIDGMGGERFIIFNLDQEEIHPKIRETSGIDVCHFYLC